MDECEEGIVVCGGGGSKNSSICLNTDGSYECRCAPGYAGSPESTHGCVGMFCYKNFHSIINYLKLPGGFITKQMKNHNAISGMLRDSFQSKSSNVKVQI